MEHETEPAHGADPGTLAPEPVRRTGRQPVAHPTGTVPLPPIVVPVRGTGNGTPVFRVPDTGPWNIGDAVREWARAAVASCAAGERLGWDTALALTPNGSGGMMTTYLLTVFLPSPVLGRPALGTVRPLPDYPTQDVVRVAVLSAVEELRNQRSRVLGNAT